MANGLKQDFADLKAIMDNFSQYSLDKQKETEQKITEFKRQQNKEVVEAYDYAYSNQLEKSEKRLNEFRKKDAEKTAKAQAKIQEKYKKKIEDTTDANEKKRLEAQQKKELEAVEKKHKYQSKLDKLLAKDAESRANAQARDEHGNDIYSAIKNGNLKELASSVADAFSDGVGLSSLTSALATYTQALNGTITQIASKKSSIDTRLQGSKNATSAGSYWDQISKDITGAAAISPLIKQSTLADKVQSMVKQGISYNVEQRAFLATISEKVADTFNATSSSLLRLVRIQQQDSTAARLGMESALTSFLNNMYETTEYMSSIMEGIQSSLEEAEALMNKEQSVQFEYQVQKWMGSFYSVGMKQNSVSSIAAALGKVAAGDISGITSDGAGNLIVMAANNAGISVADILADGLNDSDTNKLMRAMVEYLKDIYNETKDNNVVAQQYAAVFGLSASDLKAVNNISTTDTSNIASSNLKYSNFIAQLTKMANSMYSRTSQAELLENLKDNITYSLAAGIANNPALYMVYNMAQMLKSTVGGIDFSTPLVMGTGTAQTFNVADLMSTSALGGSLISGITSILSAGGNGGITGSGLLKAFGVGSNTIVQRGTGAGTGLITTSGETYSSSGYVGNSSSGDVYSKTMTDATDSANAQVATAQEENNEATTTDINDNLLLVYRLLQDVTSGTLSFKVDMGDSSAWTQAMTPNRY